MNFGRIGVTRNNGFAEFSFSASHLLGKDVASKCVPAFHFTGGSQFEALCGAFMGF
jgi:hypothetical protein